VATPPVRLQTIIAQSVIKQLQYEARLDRLSVDDDCPKTPSPLDSAQSRRAARQELINA